MTKRDYELLGRVFAAEIANALPAQTAAKRMDQLEADGMVQRDEMILGGRFPVTVTGWALTQRGRYLYCKWAAEFADDEAQP